MAAKEISVKKYVVRLSGEERERAPRPAAKSLMQRALALQTEYRFRYPLPALIGKRVTELYSKGADVLTDDFAPADLYRVTPIGVPKRKAAR